MIELCVNGTSRRLDVDPNMPLLWALREHAGLTGTKYGCGIGQCGACTVHLDGAAVRSCSVPTGTAAGKEVITIEGVRDGGHGSVAQAVQQAWNAIDVVQCGFCQPGQIMQATALLAEDPQPDDAAIARGMSGNLCRCATYARIRRAIRNAAQALA